MISKDKCTGCSACKYSCPVNAIEMKIDSLTGFNFADIDTTKCIDCGKCNNVCPHNLNQNPNEIIKRYALRMKDPILKNSSSGGAFTMISSYFFNELKVTNIVGVKWDENFNAIYSIASTGDEWKSFRGSKYMQADVRDIFHHIKAILENNEKLLFIGTPCHVSGLLNYLKKKYDNLITIDFICDSLPSPLIWQKWLNEEGFDIKNIKSINMRHKNSKGARNPTLRIEEINQAYDIYLKSTNFYRLTMGSRLLVSDACYTCNFRDYRSHVSDFTIGDLLDAYKRDELYWDENDSNQSLIICNNKRSQKIIYDIVNFHRKNIDFFNEINYGGNFGSMTEKNINAKIISKGKIYNALSRGTKLTDICKKKSNKKYLYDVAIAGGTMCNNFGGALTYYALYKYIESLGLKPIIIPPTPDSLGVVIKDNIFEKYCNVSENYHLTKSVNFNKLADTFMIGSDQIWNKKLFKEWELTPYLDFIFDEKKKIAYGVSYGNYVPAEDSEFNNIKRLVKKFDHISHREQTGCVKTSKYYDRNDTSCVIDPVFLIDKSEYDTLIEDSKIILPEDYICCYDLGISEKGRVFMQQIIGGEEVKDIYISTGNYHKQKKNRYINPRSINPISVQDWLKCIKYSKCLLTNSFHGLCFSIIYHKPFLYVGNPDDRIKELLSMVNLEDHIFDEFNPTDIYKAALCIHANIDWDAVDHKIEIHKNQSAVWLINALNKEKKYENER